MCECDEANTPRLPPANCPRAASSNNPIAETGSSKVSSKSIHVRRGDHCISLLANNSMERERLKRTSRRVCEEELVEERTTECSGDVGEYSYCSVCASGGPRAPDRHDSETSTKVTRSVGCDYEGEPR